MPSTEPLPASARPREPQDHDPAGAIETRLVFFDGVCGMCSRMVDFVLARDVRGRFRFAPLQGQTSRELLGAEASQSLDSVVLLTREGRYHKSEAVWRIMWSLGGIWRIPACLLRLVPRLMRDWGYTFVARRRYRWFGKKDACRLPTSAERARFLP
jgi:predicted DCC family thiol-disulfide oxidoreductase YuxK